MDRDVALGDLHLEKRGSKHSLRMECPASDSGSIGLTLVVNRWLLLIHPFLPGSERLGPPVPFYRFFGRVPLLK